MHQITSFLTICIFTIFFSAPKGKANTPPITMAQKGLMDLSSWDFESQGNVKLNGEWAFYWNQFKSNDQTTPSAKTFINVPTIWNNHPLIKTNKFATGFATYQLKLKVKPHKKLALKYLNSATSCKIYIDGILHFTAGNPGKTKEETTPSYEPGIIYFTPQTDEIDLTIEVANFHHKKGGLWEPLFLGSAKTINAYHNKRLFIELMLIGSIFIVSIFHFIVSKRKNKEAPSIYFALFTLMITIRLLVTGEFTIYMLGDFNWSTLVRLDYLTFYLSIVFMSILIKGLFPKEISKLHIYLICGVSLIFSLSLVLKPLYFTYGILYFQLFTIAYSLYGLVILYHVIRRKREGAKQFFIGFAILAICVIHDVLNENSIIHSFALTPFGLLIFIVSQASILSARIRNALNHNVLLISELAHQNNNFQQLNDKYKLQNEQLLIAKEKAEQSDQFKSTFLANMSHEIRTPMNGILGFSELLKYQDYSENEREEFITIINERSEQLLGIVNDIIDITKIETGQIEISLSYTQINEMMNDIHRSYLKNCTDKKIDFIKYCNLSNEFATICTDKVKLRQILDNLISNAIKFTQKGHVTFGYDLAKNYLVFYIKDSGIGISKEEEEIIFDRFNQANGHIAQTYGGTGLGLAIAKAYTEKLGGKLWLVSEKDKGSNFYFSIPYLTS